MITPGSLRITARAALLPEQHGTFSSYLTAALLNHVFVAGHSYTPAPTLYVALYTSTPTAAGGGIEVTGDAAYTRQVVAFSPTNAGAVPTVVWNNAPVQWPVATTNWGLIYSAGVLDAAVGGNLLAFGLMMTTDSIETPKLVNAGDSFLFGTGMLDMGLI